jgi:hypothetical protein
MTIRVLGGGWYGCHIAASLKRDGAEVVLHETSDRLFSGASGGNPARLHLGFHYPRSKLTRAMSQEHYAAFMDEYGHLTRTVPINIYAIAAHDSMVDFGNYRQTLQGEVEFITVDKPHELGLRNVEGALLTGERHLIIDEARAYFHAALQDVAYFEMPKTQTIDSHGFDWTIDCTFCANDSTNIARYEPCVTGLLSGPTNRAVTIMDGPFPSIYPWNEEMGLCSLTSAKWTPLARCATREAAEKVLADTTSATVGQHLKLMQEDMATFWPESFDAYKIVDAKLTIRAMPRSGSDARLVDVVRVGERALRVRAGKIDAIDHAYNEIKAYITGAK